MPEALYPPRSTPYPGAPGNASAAADWQNTSLRSALLTRILALALMSGFLLSPKLWLSARSYPLTPISDLLPTIPPPWDVIWFVVMLLLLAAITVVSRPRWLLVSLVALAAASALWDQSRWQPWFYQYLAMFGALAWAGCRPRDSHAPDAALDACRLIVVATYAWSGIEKMNATFVLDEFPTLLKPVLTMLPHSIRPLVAGSGLIVPFIELGIGLGLLLPVVRPLAVTGAVVMHLQLLLLLGPAGKNWNSVVWPWNAALIAIVLVLFWQTGNLTVRPILRARGCLSARVVLLCFGVLPGLHLVGLWDAYLSAALYSGNTVRAYVQISDADRKRLPTDLLPYLEGRGDHWRLWLDLWSMNELNVPAYPARRVYCHVANVLAACVDPEAELDLVLFEQPLWRSRERRVTTYRCGRTTR